MATLFSARGFYGRWLKTSLRALGPVDLLSGLAGSVVGVADHYFPTLKLMENLGWQIFVWALAVIVVVRLILAPYWMAKEDATKIASLETQLDEKRRRQAIADALGQVFQECQQLFNRKIENDNDVKQWTEDLFAWMDKVPNDLNGKLSDVEIYTLMNTPRGPLLSIRGFGDMEQNSRMNYLHYLQIRITDLINKHS